MLGGVCFVGGIGWVVSGRLGWVEWPVLEKLDPQGNDTLKQYPGSAGCVTGHK